MLGAIVTTMGKAAAGLGVGIVTGDATKSSEREVRTGFSSTPPASASFRTG